MGVLELFVWVGIGKNIGYLVIGNICGNGENIPAIQVLGGNRTISLYWQDFLVLGQTAYRMKYVHNRER